MVLDGTSAKRPCHTVTVRPNMPNPFKRQRTMNHGIVPAPTFVLEKPLYSKKEVQDILEEVEREYTQKLDKYCAEVREMLLSNHAHTAVSSTHSTSYIS